MGAAIFKLVIGTQFGRVLLIVAAVALCLWFLVDEAGDRREEQVRAEIERKTQGAVNAANQAAIPVGVCHDLGGDWVQHVGRCQLPRVPGTN